MSLRKPPLGEVWVHVDLLGREDGRVWAVQDHTKAGKPRYRTGVMVHFDIVGKTGTAPDQPKAVLRIPNGRAWTWRKQIWVTNR